MRAGGLFYYGDIPALSEQDYLRRFQDLTVPELRTEVLSQAHAKAAVVEAKFRNVRRAIALLFAAVTV